MLHACFAPIALCFVYTSWYFYAFFGTNLLIRCHSASSYFLLFLCFRKVTQEIFSELDETKAKVPIYLTRRRNPKERRRRAKRRPHHREARAIPWPRHQVVWPLVHPLTSPFGLYIHFVRKTLRYRSLFHETYCKPPPSSSRDREGPEALPGILSGWGIAPGAISIDSTAIFFAVADFHDEEGVALP
jgi:hypothetical protein